MMNSKINYFIHFVFKSLPETRCFGFKRFLLRICGAKIGDNVRICSSVNFYGDGDLEIGDNTWIGPMCLIYTSSKIKIGQDVNIAPRCVVLNGTHKIEYDQKSVAGIGYCEDVCIEDGCWLCTNSTILGSSVIGCHSIVAACSCTKGQYPPNSLIKGVIAKYVPLKK